MCAEYWSVGTVIACQGAVGPIESRKECRVICCGRRVEEGRSVIGALVVLAPRVNDDVVRAAVRGGVGRKLLHDAWAELQRIFPREVRGVSMIRRESLCVRATCVLACVKVLRQERFGSREDVWAESFGVSQPWATGVACEEFSKGCDGTFVAIVVIWFWWQV
jgi:hypothetical protein